MAETIRPLGITDTMLHGAPHANQADWQLEDVLPVAEKLDQAGFWALGLGSVASFATASEDDPWARLRGIKAAMPHTPLLISLCGDQLESENIEQLVRDASRSGVSVFRVYLQGNDARGWQRIVEAIHAHGAHAQGCLPYTREAAADEDSWLNMAQEVAAQGVDSLLMEDARRKLTPYMAYTLVSRLKARLDIPVHLNCSARAGLANATLLKAAEAGADGVDSAFLPADTESCYSVTGAVVAMLAGSDRDTGIELAHVDDIAAYFMLLYQHGADSSEAASSVSSATQQGEDDTQASVYTVTVNSIEYVVEVAEGGDITQVHQHVHEPKPVQGAADEVIVEAPLAGSVIRVNVKPGDAVTEGDVVLLLEAMKMETEVRAAEAGTVSRVNIAEGDSVTAGDMLIALQGKAHG
ncbi:MAG: biotin/lipoyl-binding protein [Halomonas subglaciescola]|nr:biotin/lipoyl-binding protein [Halomonas subglaciescola]